MSGPDSKSDGWFNSLRRTADSLLGLLHARLELLAVEWQEEKLRALRLLVWFGLAVILGVAGLLVALGALSLFLWSVAGYAGLVGLSVVTLGAAGGVFWTLHRRLQESPPPFEATLAEFRKDRECLRPKSPTNSPTANGS